MAPERDGQAHEEGEAGGAVAAEAREPADGDGDARARQAGLQGEGLGRAHQQRVAQPHLVDRALAPHAVGPRQRQRPHDHHHGDEPDLVGVLLDGVGQQRAGDRGRHGRQRDQPGEPAVLRARGSHGRPGQAHDVVAEVGDGPAQRAEVQRHVEGLLQRLVAGEVVPAEQPRHHDEVARRGDREVLGESLGDAQDDGVEDRHVYRWSGPAPRLARIFGSARCSPTGDPPRNPRPRIATQ